MATNTAGSTAREYPQQMVHYMRRTVNHDTPSIRTAGAVKLGTLPAGAQILQCLRISKVAFDGTGPTLSVGTNASSYNNIDNGGTEATTAAVISTVAAFLSFTQDTDVYILLDESTTTPSTAGQAVIVLSYVPDNDTQAE